MSGNATYNTLDLQTLMLKKAKTVSSEEALREVEPVQWNEEVMQSQQKVTVVKGKRD